MNVIIDINELCFAYLEASGRFWSISSGAPNGIPDVTHVPHVGRQLTNPECHYIPDERSEDMGV